jgi:hypothetical protein
MVIQKPFTIDIWSIGNTQFSKLNGWTHSAFLCSTHRYLRKADCSTFVFCLLLAVALPREFLGRPQIVIARQTMLVLCAIDHSIFNMMSMVVPKNCELKHQYHRHLRKINWLMARTSCLVCLVGTVSGCHKNALGKGSTSSQHITKFEQSYEIF